MLIGNLNTLKSFIIDKIDSSKNYIIVFYFEQIFTLFFDQRQENLAVGYYVKQKHALKTLNKY